MKLIKLSPKQKQKKQIFNTNFNCPNYINQLYLGQDFPMKNIILKELKQKRASYLAQDKKKKPLLYKFY